MTIRFTDLREWVLALDGFDDDPKSSNEPKLEMIQMAWYEETRSRSDNLSRARVARGLELSSPDVPNSVC